MSDAPLNESSRHEGGYRANNPTPARDAVERTKDLEALVLHMYASPDMYSDELIRYRVTALLTAARADERAQLAARATDQERGMVEAAMQSGGACACPQHIECAHDRRRAEARTTLLAALTASRERAIEEAVRWACRMRLGSFKSADDAVAASLRALAAQAVADTTAPEVAAGAAPQRAEGEGG